MGCFKLWDHNDHIITKSGIFHVSLKQSQSTAYSHGYILYTILCILAYKILSIKLPVDLQLMNYGKTFTHYIYYIITLWLQQVGWIAPPTVKSHWSKFHLHITVKHTCWLVIALRYAAVSCKVYCQKSSSVFFFINIV